MRANPPTGPFTAPKLLDLYRVVDKLDNPEDWIGYIRSTYPVTPWWLRWIETMRNTPWVFCDDCQEFTMGIDAPQDVICECWLDPERDMEPEWLEAEAA